MKMRDVVLAAVAKAAVPDRVVFYSMGDAERHVDGCVDPIHYAKQKRTIRDVLARRYWWTGAPRATPPTGGRADTTLVGGS